MKRPLVVTVFLLLAFQGRHAVGQSFDRQGAASMVIGSRTPSDGGAPLLSNPYPSYSYFASTGPARGYVSWGAYDGFAYYGRPYGHTYDRWSWSALGGATGAPARYFYAPVR